MKLSLTQSFYPMYKPALLAGSMAAMLAVIFGAFGAHYLKSIFTPELLQSFETGVRYQFYHAFALLFVAIYAAIKPDSKVRLISIFFIAGIILFSGSIYALCWLKSTAHIGLGGLGILTPLGGVCFISGWLLLLLSALPKSN